MTVLYLPDRIVRPDDAIGALGVVARSCNDKPATLQFMREDGSVALLKPKDHTLGVTSFQALVPGLYEVFGCIGQTTELIAFHLVWNGALTWHLQLRDWKVHLPDFNPDVVLERRHFMSSEAGVATSWERL